MSFKFEKETEINNLKAIAEKVEIKVNANHLNPP